MFNIRARARPNPHQIKPSVTLESNLTVPQIAASSLGLYINNLCPHKLRKHFPFLYTTNTNKFNEYLLVTCCWSTFAYVGTYV